jgi:hypothetical protein
MSELGRAVYTYKMAMSYLRERRIPIPQYIAQEMVRAFQAWRSETEAMDTGFLTSRSATAAPTIDGRRAPETGYVQEHELPLTSRCSADDASVISQLPLAWDGLSSARRSVLLLRMACSYVAEEYGGAVPQGLVQRSVAAAAALG